MEKLAKDLPSPDSRYVDEQYPDFAIPSSKQQRDLFHMSAETTRDHVGMQSVRASTRLFPRHPQMKNQTRLHQSHLRKLIKKTLVRDCQYY